MERTQIPSLVLPTGPDPDTDVTDAAEAAVRAYCGWHIAPVITQEIILDGFGTESLFLPTLKLLSIDAVHIGGIEYSPADLEWTENGFARLPGGWPDRLRSIKLTITHGHDVAPDVAAVVRAVADRDRNSPGGIVREQAGAMSLQFSNTAAGVAGGIVVMAHEREQLEPYKLRAVA